MELKILQVVPNGYLPDLSGGLEITVNSMQDCLVDTFGSTHVAAACTHSQPAYLFTKIRRKMAGAYCSKYRIGKHTVHIDAWHPHELHKLANKIKPTIIICNTTGNDAAINSVTSLDIPTLFYIHNNTRSPKILDAINMRNRCFACVSEFIGSPLREALNEPVEIVRPLLIKNDYTIDKTGNDILVVNPHPMKGGGLVVEIAQRMPHRNFLVVGGWSTTTHDPDVVRIESSISQLANVKRVPHLADMRLAYRQARCLLMPSLVEEGYGRAAAEALIAGIPVLASNRGALPATVGLGGITLDPDAPLQQWIDQLEAFYLDEPGYLKLAHQAKIQAREKERQPAFIQNQLCRLIDQLRNSK